MTPDEALAAVKKAVELNAQAVWIAAMRGEGGDLVYIPKGHVELISLALRAIAPDGPLCVVHCMDCCPDRWPGDPEPPHCETCEAARRALKGE